MLVDLQEILEVYPEFATDFLLTFRVTFNLRQVSMFFIVSQIEQFIVTLILTFSS